MATSAPPNIAKAARARIADAMPQIRHSMTAIDAGRPGDAETEFVRRVQVYQARTGVSLEAADRKVSASDGGATLATTAAAPSGSETSSAYA